MTSMQLAPSHEWPEHYPESCPPQDASPVNCTVFRLVSDPVDVIDCLSHFELDIEVSEDRRCQSCGLSIYLTLEDALTARKRTRSSALKCKAIASTALTPSQGVYLRTPPDGKKGHHTWWVPSGLTIHPSIFHVVEPAIPFEDGED